MLGHECIYAATLERPLQRSYTVILERFGQHAGLMVPGASESRLGGSGGFGSLGPPGRPCAADVERGAGPSPGQSYRRGPADRRSEAVECLIAIVVSNRFAAIVAGCGAGADASQSRSKLKRGLPRCVVNCPVEQSHYVIMACPTVIVERHQPIPGTDEGHPFAEATIKRHLLGQLLGKSSFCFVRVVKTAATACQ